MKPIFLFLLLSLICYPIFTQATHLKGAELTATRSNSSALTYTFTLILYEEPGGVKEEANFMDVGNGQKAALGLVAEELLDEKVSKKTYTATYTYAAAGLYQVSYTGSNRNYAVNITDGHTSRLYIELQLFINQSVGINNSPVFQQPPRFYATAGEPFTDDYHAIDLEGDSLVYKLVPPFAVTNYIHPATVGGDTENTFTIDSRSGHISWEVPAYIGKYVFAVQVEEWRQGVKIGLTYRDIQITVTGKEPGHTPPAEERTFNIFPNPANDKVYITLPQSTPETLAQIWSIKGQLLLQQQLQPTGHADGMLPVAHLPPGVYILHVKSLDVHIRRRLIVMH